MDDYNEFNSYKDPNQMGIGDWGLGIGDWAQSPIPQSPNPNPQYFVNRRHIYLNN